MAILGWQTLIFLVPILLGTIYLVLMALGATFGEHDINVEHGGDVSLDQGDVAVDHGDLVVDHGDAALDQGDMSIEHDVDAGHGDTGNGGSAGFLGALLGFLGLGKVPVTVLMMSYCFVWGIAGLVTVILVGQAEIWTAIGVAAAAAILITGQLASGLGRLVPPMASYHTPLRYLVGLRGEVLYAITADSGTVRVRDERCDLRDVPARVAPGAKSIASGTKVVLTRYDVKTRTFAVEP